MKKKVLIIGFGIDSNRLEAVSQNTVKHMLLLQELEFEVYLYNIGYNNLFNFTGNGFMSAFLLQRKIIKDLELFVTDKQITHILDVFVLPLSSIIFTLQIKKIFPNVKFIKEIHNDYGFSKKFQTESLIRILTNNKYFFDHCIRSFDKLFTNNLYLSNKYSIDYIPTKITISKSKKYKNIKLNICYLGHPLKKKGIQKILELFSIIDSNLKSKIKFNFAFSDVGPRDKVENDFLIAAKKNNISISFYGNVEPTDFFRKNDIYLLPIEDEYGAISTPNTILEAMEAKCLVISNNISSLKGIARHKKNIFLLKNNNANFILFAIKEIINNKPMKELIINNARNFIINNNSISIIKEKVKKLYV